MSILTVGSITMWGTDQVVNSRFLTVKSDHHKVLLILLSEQSSSFLKEKLNRVKNSQAGIDICDNLFEVSISLEESQFVFKVR